MRIKSSTLLFILGFFLFTITPVFSATPAPEYIQFTGAAKGALYRPDPSLFPKPHVGILIMHRNSNFLSHIGTKELSSRGFVTLGMNPRCDNNEALCRPWENNALDVKQGVNYLKKLPGITKIILFGHSGGGPTMSFYEAVAENGVSYCQGSNKLVECDNTLAGLPRADGIIFMDGHPGNGVNAVRSINPAITNDSAVLNENRAAKINPELDPFNPKNGYNPKGPSTYSEAFKKKYFQAQSDRMNILIKEASERIKHIKGGTYKYPDDDAFIVPGGDGARLAQLDMSVHHSTVKPQKLVKNDGSVVTQIVESARVPSLTPKVTQEFNSAMFLTVRSFLSVRAIKSKDSMDEIDWCSSNNSTPCALPKVSVPILVTAMGAHYFIRDSEIYYDMAASKDKDFVTIEGATHGGTPCTECEQTPGQYSNTVKNLFDYVRDWINARY